MFVADLYGGPRSLKVGKQSKMMALPDGGKFKYVWDQQRVDPLSGRVFNAIHFRVGAGNGCGKRIHLMTGGCVVDPPELRDAMMEAGFRSTEVHDRMGGAIDAEVNLYVKPVEAEELERDYVVYVVGRGVARASLPVVQHTISEAVRSEEAPVRSSDRLRARLRYERPR